MFRLFFQTVHPDFGTSPTKIAIECHKVLDDVCKELVGENATAGECYTHSGSSIGTWSLVKGVPRFLVVSADSEYLVAVKEYSLDEVKKLMPTEGLVSWADMVANKGCGGEYVEFDSSHVVVYLGVKS